MFRGFKVKVEAKDDWLKRHVGHDLREFYLGGEDYIIAKIQCMDCGEVIIFSILNLKKEG